MSDRGANSPAGHCRPSWSRWQALWPPAQSAKIAYRVICRAIDVLPSCVSALDRDDVEASLVRQATKTDAEILKAAARHIDEIFNPDGDYDEADRARRRALHIGARGPDGMSRLSGFSRSASRGVTASAARPTTYPTAPWPKYPMNAMGLSAAMTASNSGSRPAWPLADWDPIAGIRSP